LTGLAKVGLSAVILLKVDSGSQGFGGSDLAPQSHPGVWYSFEGLFHQMHFR